ncbi:hypothetical protein J7J00_17605 [Bacillus sp. ISL-4]|uniref:hypothetical protein n=1 Tax=Bacillus sp. ISL-4 TaxID=2819125 RepID=UPI001BE6A5F2|nr:hypothetical protein [Bacillus sp. ISL-4]MBT2667298.1 hypothetical protein [Bacillus sp. ISL-4]MBT2670604.1 hypothetical protein [Streptomyces sp. ISL-14]
MSDNILDDLFQWASEQPEDHLCSVDIAIATNDMSRNNLVSYAEGTIHFDLGSISKWVSLQPRFKSYQNGIKQYFSDRRRGDCPFDCNETEPLDVLIVPRFSVNNINYIVTMKSSKWNFEFSFEPSFDVESDILYGVFNKTFITISFCNKRSEPPIK